MDEMNRTTNSEEQDEKQRAFQRTVWLQIYLPMLAGVLVLGGLVAWIWIAGPGTGSAWADSAFTLLSIPAMILGLLLLGVLGALVYVVILIIQKLPAPAAQVQEIFAQIAVYTRRFADQAARPVLIPRAFWASLRRAGRVLGSIFARESSDK